AAARVAGHRMDQDRMFGWQKALVDKRAQERNGAGRVAAWVGNTPCACNRFRLAGGKLWKAVRPTFRNPVRSRGVENARAPVAQRGRDRGGFAGSLVWKAKNNNISLFHYCLLGSRILALPRWRAEEFDFGISFQARANA